MKSLFFFALLILASATARADDWASTYARQAPDTFQTVEPQMPREHWPSDMRVMQYIVKKERNALGMLVALIYYPALKEDPVDRIRQKLFPWRVPTIQECVDAYDNHQVLPRRCQALPTKAASAELKVEVMRLCVSRQITYGDTMPGCPPHIADVAYEVQREMASGHPRPATRKLLGLRGPLDLILHEVQ